MSFSLNLVWESLISFGVFSYFLVWLRVCVCILQRPDARVVNFGVVNILNIIIVIGLDVLYSASILLSKKKKLFSFWFCPVMLVLQDRSDEYCWSRNERFIVAFIYALHVFFGLLLVYICPLLFTEAAPVKRTTFSRDFSSKIFSGRVALWAWETFYTGSGWSTNRVICWAFVQLFNASGLHQRFW